MRFDFTERGAYRRKHKEESMGTIRVSSRRSRRSSPVARLGLAWVLLFALAMAFGSSTSTQAAVIELVDQQQPTAGTANVISKTYAQTFTAGKTGPMDQVSLLLSKVFYGGASLGSGNLLVGIYATSNGSPTGAALASGAINNANVSSLGLWHDITLSPTIGVVTGTTYAIVVIRDWSQGYFEWYGTGGESYAGGEMFLNLSIYDDAAGPWSSLNRDAAFMTYVKTTVQDQTITFGALADKTYGDASFTVSATASSSLPVSFAAAPSATCASSGTNGGTLAIVGVGTCTVTASQAGNNQYGAAPAVAQSFTVKPAALTVTAPSPRMTYGDQTLPNLTAVNYSGYVNGDGASALGGTLSCALTNSTSNAVTLSSGLAAGSYTVTCQGQTSSNYQITYQSGTLIVASAPLTITAANQQMVLHGTVPSFTVTYASFVNGESSAALTSPPACTTTATNSSAAGSYPITCAGAVDPNYTIGYVPGALKVLFQWSGFAAPLTSSAQPQVFKAGATIPIKFQLTDATGAVVQASSLPTFAVSAPVSCAAATVDSTGTTATGDTGTTFRWDSTAQQYIYNYHTDKSLTGACQTITVTLADGSSQSVAVAFR